MPHPEVLFAVDDTGIAQVTINRPDRLNALSGAVLDHLGRAFDEVTANARIRGAILTGAGDKAFVAGADIAELAALSPSGARDYAELGQNVFRRIEVCGKPVVAAVNGFALGGGMELAMACAIRFASDTAKFGQPEVKLGLIPGFGGTQRLPRLVGRGRALELLLSGEPVSASEAYRIGLVNAVTPPSELHAFSHSWLMKTLANGPEALRLVLDTVDAGLELDLAGSLQLEAAAFESCAATEDWREGTRAFLEKRKPRFAGK
jgi:enoyl-CoA hydratase/carnithine racemase